jgi:hypothetical protein
LSDRLAIISRQSSKPDVGTGRVMRHPDGRIVAAGQDLHLAPLHEKDAVFTAK